MAPLSYPHTLRYKHNQAPSYIAIWRWSPTFVLRERLCFPFFFSKEFQEKVPNRFTYHSIAPAFGASYRPSTPEEEEGAVLIDLKELPNSLYKRLIYNWPDLYKGKHEDFINYEWKTHGIQSELDPVDYLTMAVFITERYDIGLALHKHGIVPGCGTYYPSDIRRCLRSEFGVEPALMNYFENNVQFVYEIKMRFDTNLQAIDLVTGQPPPITLIKEGSRLFSKAINDLEGSKERGKKRGVNDLEGNSLKIGDMIQGRGTKHGTLFSKAINDLEGSKERGKKKQVNDLEGKSLKIGDMIQGRGTKHGSPQEESSAAESSRRIILCNPLKNPIGSLSPTSVVTSPNTSHVQESWKTITRAGGKTPKGADVIENRGTNLGCLKEQSKGRRITILCGLQNTIESTLTRPRPVVTSPSAPTTAPPVCAVVPTASPSASAVIPHLAPAPSTHVNLSAPVIYENMKNIAQRYM